jgi:hypothetical protein
MRGTIAGSLFLVLTLPAWGQYIPGGPWGVGGYGYGGVPGLYGGGLSPFLNIRGRNQSRAVNYFNFARPYTGGTFGNAIVAPYAPIQADPGGAMTGRFFPVQAPFWEGDNVQPQRAIPNAKPDENGLTPTQMPPAGQGGGFANTMGYFGVGNAVGVGGRPGVTLGRPRPR